jgi:hypothetical protein
VSIDERRDETRRAKTSQDDETKNETFRQAVHKVNCPVLKRSKMADGKMAVMRVTLLLLVAFAVATTAPVADEEAELRSEFDAMVLAQHP